MRVLNLAHALATARRGIALRAFAKKRRFPERSVYNDFKTLEKAGFPIVEVQRGRYRMSDTWRPIGMPHLDSDEALALFLARQLMSNMRATSMGRALDRVWTKLSGKGAQAAIVPDDVPWLSVRAPIAIDYTSASDLRSPRNGDVFLPRDPYTSGIARVAEISASASSETSSESRGYSGERRRGWDGRIRSCAR